MSTLYYKNESEGYFTDGKITLMPKQWAEVEKGKESKKLIQAWKAGGLSQSLTKPSEGSEMFAEKKPASSKPKAKPFQKKEG